MDRDGDDNDVRRPNSATTSDVEGSVSSSRSAAADDSSSSPPPQPPTPTSPEPGYDPKRIPSSVFASKSGKGIDWSTASNESLFSIYMGNNSFSREQIAMMYRSGELPMLDQDYSVPPPATTWQPPLPPSSPAAARRNGAVQPINNINIINIHVPAAAAPPPPSNNNITVTVPPEVQLPPPPPQSAAGSLNRNSTASSSTNRNSTSSTNSFQFPILQNEQMGRNSTRKVEETEQKAVAGEKVEVAVVEEGKKEEETHQVEKQEEEKQESQQQPQTTSEEAQPTSSSSCSTAAAARSWLSCLPCFSRSTSS